MTTFITRRHTSPSPSPRHRTRARPPRPRKDAVPVPPLALFAPRSTRTSWLVQLDLHKVTHRLELQEGGLCVGGVLVETRRGADDGGPAASFGNAQALGRPDMG